MRRPALAILLGALLATTSPVEGRSSEVRWIAYIRAGEQVGPGSLIAVRPGGGSERTLLDAGVVSADAGGAGAVFALVRRGETSELLRVRIGTGAADGPRAAGSLSGIAAARGRVAVERRVASGSDVPRHLRGAVEELATTSITVLAPPRRPPGTTHTVASVGGRRYELRFTNDPDGVLSHAEQVNIFVGASPRPVAPLPDALPVEVRGTQGSFSCGASACFLDWEEGSSYAVGEFGRPEDAIEFAESLRPMEELVGPSWREGGTVAAPQLVVLGGSEETVLESVEGFCECSFHPMDWDDAGERLLVVTRAEGFTTVTEYGRPDGPEVLHEAAGRAILDASYTPEGVAMIESPAVGRPGPVRTLDGRTLARRAISFDVEGSTMAVVRGNGDVLVRNLETGAEQVVGTGAISVTVSPGGVAPAPSEGAPERPPHLNDEGPPAVPFGIAVAALIGASVLGGATLLLIRRRG